MLSSFSRSKFLLSPSRCFSSLALDSIPQPFDLNAAQFLESWKKGSPVLEDGYSRYGKIIRVPWGDEPSVWILHPSTAQQAFQQEGSAPMITISDEEKLFIRWAKLRGIPYADPTTPEAGKKKQELRSKLQKEIFPPKVADAYYPLLEPTVQEISREICYAKSLYEYIGDASADMFFTAILGRNSHTVLSHRTGKTSPDKEFIDAAASVLAILSQSLRSPTVDEKQFPEFVKQVDVIMKHMVRYIGEVTTNQYKKKVLDVGKKLLGLPITEPHAVLYRLAKSSGMTPFQISQEFPPLFFAGLDTVQSAMSWILVHLAQNPEKQDLLFQEISQLKSFDAENIKKLAYLKGVLRETFRLTRLGTIVYRRYQHDVELEGYRIPKGTLIIRDFDGLGRDPTIVKDADKFLPERWSEQEVAARKGTPQEIIDHRMMTSYIFGWGSRMCLGARLADVEMKAFTIQLVKDWKFEIAPNQNTNRTDLGTLNFLDPFPAITFKPRKLQTT